MACGRSLLYLFTFFAIITTILAREGRGEREHSESEHRNPHREGPPSSNEKDSNEQDRPPPPHGGQGNRPQRPQPNEQQGEDASTENHEPGSGDLEDGSSNERAFGFQFPSFGSSSNLGSMTLPDFMSLFNSGSGSGSSGSQVPDLGSLFGGSRSERTEPSNDDENNDEHMENGEQNRLFFSTLFNFGTLTTCNYRTQAGATCTACRQVLRCYPNNVGRVKTCRGLFRYCNNGRCSLFPGTACTATTASSATATTSGTTSGSTPSG